MNGDQPITWLMFFTLVAAIVIAAGGFLYFLRSQRNRNMASDALAGHGSTVGPTPTGAFPELAGVTVIGLVAMGLLAAGYKSNETFKTARATAPGGTTGLAQPAGIADQPKPYQPANPSPDLRTAPTSSDAGAGPENGSTGMNK
jgi:hypothetical protein